MTQGSRTPETAASEEFDTIIVGAGSAGCVLAGRLSSDPERSVLLLEAGPKDTYPWLHIPVGYFKSVGNSRCDWRLETEPEPELFGRRVAWPRGKVLGGSSAINGLIAIRGQREDYESWREAGCEGWGWDDVFPYFIRLEDQERGADRFHGASGPLRISDTRARHPLCETYMRAAEELGIPPNPDFNGERQEGSGYYQVTIRRGLRVSAAAGYLRSGGRRPNLKIVTGALAHRITFDAHRADGIVYSVNGELRRARARRQVILSAGVVFSPHLLALSGVGDGERLKALGLEVVHSLPEVGRNLQDHLQTRSIYRSTRPTLNDETRTLFKKAWIALEGLLLGRGPLWGLSQLGIFARTDASLTRPDVQFHVHPASTEKPGDSLHPFSGFTVSVCQLRPESRGSIETRSPDPTQLPAIHANYLSAELDRRVVCAYLRLVRRIAATGSMRELIAEELWPGPSARSDEELLDFARRTAITTYHPVGTCRMGADAGAVVDPRLRVRGVSGLYVVDASIMPTLVSGNTHLPTVMVAEKASDMIRQDEAARGFVHASMTKSAPEASVTRRPPADRPAVAST